MVFVFIVISNPIKPDSDATKLIVNLKKPKYL